MLGRLLERDAVVAAVAETLERARTGRGCCLFVAGDAGTGKTAILDEATRLAGAAMDCARGRGEEMETGIALGLLDQVLRAVPGGRSLDSLAPALEPSAPYRHALRQLERRDDRPLLITLDDLHWSDADSLNAFAFLARRLRQLPVAVIATLRPWPRAAHDACRALVECGDARWEAVTPLTPPAARVLLAEQLGRPLPDGVESRAWELCRGNPLLIEQLAADLRRDGPVADSRDGAPNHARRLLVRHFVGLDDPSLRYARCASVMGTGFRPEVALEVAELAPPLDEQALDALYRSGLVTDDDTGWLRFVHPLVRQALYDDLPPPIRQRLHGRTFEALVRRGLTQEAAEHAIRADLTGSRKAAALLERVGRAALDSGAAMTACRNLETAVRFRGDQAEPGLRLALAEALCAGGQMPAAASACSATLAVPGLARRDRVAALILLGRCRYLGGEADRGESVLREAVAIAEADDPVQAVLPLLDQCVSAWMATGPGRALPLAARARELARTGTAELRETVEAIWGHLTTQCGDPDGIAATAPIARRLSGGSGTPAIRTTELVTPRASIYAYANCAQYAEHFDEALAALELAREQIERAGAANAVATVSIFIGNALIRRGRLREALDAADRAERSADLTPLAIPFAALTRAQALLWLGRVEESEAEARRGEGAAAEQWTISLWAAHVRGLRLLWAGDPEASGAFLVAERVARAAGIGEPNQVQWAGHAIAAHLAAGRSEDATRVLDELEQRAAVHPSRWPRFAATLGRARVAEHTGADEAALAGYRAAMTALGDADLPLQRAEGLLAYGGFLRRRGRSVDARQHLAEALGIAETHEAAGLAQLARGELRLAGGRRRHARDSSLLTPAELRVAGRAGAGLSNAEIAGGLQLSVHTVETHLKRVYAKLGISGRRRLAGLDLDERSRPAGVES